jgi:hypothetical protein
MSHPWTCLEQVRRAALTFQLTGFRDAMLQLIMTGIQLIMTDIQLIMTGIQFIMMGIHLIMTGIQLS